MPTHVLVGFDGSTLAEHALDFALRRFPDARVTALYAIDPVDSVVAVEAGGLNVSEGWVAERRQEAESVLSAARSFAEEVSATVEGDYVFGRPSKAIVEYAAEHDVDHVVLGSHGRTGVERLVLGSVAEHVVRSASMPVTVVR